MPLTDEQREAWFFRFTVAACIFLLGAIAGDCLGARMRSKAKAHDTAPRDLALALARTTVNEAGLDAWRDLRLIYDASRSHAHTDHGRLRWLVAHSACTNPGDCNRDGVVNALDWAAARDRPGRAGWTRYLQWSDERPPGVRNWAQWDPARWRQLREYALRLVRADRSTGVCPYPVVSWGTREAFGPRDPLIPLDCGARNLGATTRALVRRARAHQ